MLEDSIIASWCPVSLNQYRTTGIMTIIFPLPHLPLLPIPFPSPNIMDVSDNVDGEGVGGEGVISRSRQINY